MRFRQDDVEKRISDKTLLPVSVTYEDTRLDDEDEYQFFDVYFYDRSTPELKKHKDDDVFRYDGYVLTPGLAKAIKAIAPYAICNEPILIEGADGTGKEMLARAVHANCLLDGPFVLVDCGSYTPAEFESAMVGSRGKPGLVKRAEGGSLYLKDIEKLTLSMQELVLELLDPILDPDDDDEDEVEIQVIASCSPNIKSLLTKKKFSRDLYRALKEGYAVLPTLREHPSSILPLFKQFVETAGNPQGKATKKAKPTGRAEPYSFAKDVNTTLIRLKWPGNYDDLIRCATLVSQEVARKPGTITGATIKERLEGPRDEPVETGSPAKEEAVFVAVQPRVDPQVAQLVPAEPQMGFLSDPTDHRVQLPENMSRSWKDEWFPEYQKARRNSERWSAMKGIISATAKELCDKFKNRGGLKAITLRALMENEVPDDTLLRMLVARRVILSYWDLINTRAGGYDQLIRELGFVSKDQADLGKSAPAIQEENFRNYLSSIGLKKKTIKSPLESEGLLEEEVEWFKGLFPPDIR